ncbi:acyl carrier protein [Streptomyces vietnamensis]|uniref:acyl carrier protein n=1 Tax=Streptomyces vietnamensis TaxID=362257 RepID=UPI0037B5CD2A
MSHTWNDAPPHTDGDAAGPAGPDTTATRVWLARRVAEHLRMAPADLSPDIPLSEYGLDSVYALSVAADLEDRLGITVDPTVLWDNPTLNALCAAVERSAAPATPSSASAGEAADAREDVR